MCFKVPQSPNTDHYQVESKHVIQIAQTRLPDVYKCVYIAIIKSTFTFTFSSVSWLPPWSLLAPPPVLMSLFILIHERFLSLQDPRWFEVLAQANQ